MAWNEPGGNKDKDPWGNDQGPPDLDEAFRKFKEKFSGGNGSGSGSGGSNSDMPDMGPGFIGLVLGVLLVVWAGFGFYTIDQQEQGVVLRFGKYTDTVSAGLHWNPPLIDTVQKVNVTKVRSVHTRGLMLTEDENIVEVSLSVQYTVLDPKKFLLEVRDPESSLEHAAESALRHVVGSAKLDQILTEGRAAVAIELQERLQTYLENYHTGIKVVTINIEDAQPPTQVQAAFDDVIRAKEDEQRLKNEAEAYKNSIIPVARGLAQRQLEEANGYKEQVIAKAEGEAERFSQLLKEYEKAPRVTRERLYIDAMESVMKNATKVMVDVDGGNMMYLPLDQIIKQSQNAAKNLEADSGYYSNDNDIRYQSPRTSRDSSRREGR